MTSFRVLGQALVLGVCVLAWGCSAGPDATAAQLEGGQRFTLKDLEGNDVSLDSLLASRKAVLVNFWATWCPPCREEIPDLIRLQEAASARGLTVLGVDVGESQAKVASFVKKYGINYPVVLDSDMKVAESYRVVGIPTTLLIDSKGSVLGKYHAYTPELVRDVESVLSS